MSKSKKLLSVLLALVMVLTTAVVGFSAFAADDERAEYDDYVAKFEPTVVELPENLSEKGAALEFVNNLLDMVAGLIPEDSGVDLNNLDKLLEEGVYTNYTIGMITTLYDTIAQMIAASGDMMVTMVLGSVFDPVRLSVSKNDKQPAAWSHLPAVAAKLAEATDAAIEAGEDVKNGKLVTPTVAYNYAEWESGDWGFEDGDRDGFVTALGVVLRPVFSTLFEGTLAPSLVPFTPDERWNNYQNQQSKPVIVEEGLYADLFMLLEPLGADLMSVKEYSMNYLDEVYDESKPAGYKGAPNNNGVSNYNWAATDMLSKPLLDGVFSILDKALADPTQSLADVLVNLAYLVDVGGVDGVVSTIIEKLNNSILSMVLAGVEIPSLTGDGINELLTAAPIAIPLNEETSIELTLLPINWKALANCCTVEVAESGLYEGAYTIKRTADFDTVFASLFYYLFDTITAEDNLASVKTALATLAPDQADMIGGILDGLASLDKVEALGELVAMFNGGEDEPPVGGDNPPEGPDIPVTGMIF